MILDELLLEELVENGITEIANIAKAIGASESEILRLVDMAMSYKLELAKEGKELPEELNYLIAIEREGKLFLNPIATFGIVGILDKELGYPFHQEILDANKEAFKKEINL